MSIASHAAGAAAAHAVLVEETRAALRKHGGNRARAAAELKISAGALFERMKSAPELKEEFPAKIGRPKPSAAT